MIVRTLIGASLLATTGCVTVAPAEDGIPVHGGGGICEANKAEALIGRTATAELSAEAMRLTGANAVRSIRPGQMVTMEYREGRLNIKLDAQNRVTGFSCG